MDSIKILDLIKIEERCIPPVVDQQLPLKSNIFYSTKLDDLAISKLNLYYQI